VEVQSALLAIAGVIWDGAIGKLKKACSINRMSHIVPPKPLTSVYSFDMMLIDTGLVILPF
jgi:hypothetical protein